MKELKHLHFKQICAFLSKGNQDSEEYEEVPLVDALNGYLPADGATGKKSKNSRIIIGYSFDNLS